MADASFYRSVQNVKVTVAAATAAGELRQLPSGLVGTVANQGVAYNAGDRVDYATTGSWVVPKNSAIALLDGGRAYWDFTNGRADYRKTDNQRDYYLGRVVGDSLVGTSQCTVLLNSAPADSLDLDRDGFYSAPIGTQALGGFLPAQRYGQSNRLTLDAVNQAEKVDALGKLPGFYGLAPAVVEMGIEVVSVGTGATPVFCVGIASGTHATAVTSITQYLTARVNGNSTNIQVQASDGTNTLAPTTAGTLTAGTRFEIWFDLRTPAAVKMYLNGVQVLSSTTINVGAAAASWRLLAHLVKTAAVDQFQADVDWLRARTMRL